MAIYCSNCGASLPDGVAFCDACGTPVRNQQGESNPAYSPAAGPSTTYVQGGAGAAGLGSTVCPVCGAAALPGEAFCDNCGAALMPSGSYAPGPAPAAAPSPAPAPAPQYQPVQTGGYANPGYGGYGGYAPSVQRTASLVITSPPPPATLPVPGRAELIVGRSDPQSNSYPDLDLGPYGGLELGVSRRHFRLSRTGEQYYIEDLGSVNGTIINGQRIPPHNLHPLRPGDRISLGKMELLFELS